MSLLQKRCNARGRVTERKAPAREESGGLYTGRRFHFVGAGGIGMSGLAKLLLRNGAIVSGSDQEDSTIAAELRCLGADIRIGHDAANLGPELDAVVISAAVKPDNPEVLAAQQAGRRIHKYARMLGQIMDRYKGIAVCGTHGKSTSTGWLAYVLREAGISPNFVVGAAIPQLGGSSGVGEIAGWFVAEACEYDRSFLNLHPRICVILNIEQDHLDYYRDEAEIVDAFADFADNVPQGGTLIVNAHDANVGEVVRRRGRARRVVSFGLRPDADFYARNLTLTDGLYRFEIVRGGKPLGFVQIGLPGEHNVFNALAVTAAAVSAGVDPAVVLNVLGGFTGADRRLMLKAVVAGVTVLDDYAHHPTEIRASLSAMRQRYAPRRLWCVFQPHQYSRTRFLLEDFAESFRLADVTIVPDIYFVRDTMESRKEVNAQVLADRICAKGAKAVFIPDFASIREYLKTHVQAGDLVVTMGAGNVWKVADEYIQWLGENRQDQLRPE